MRYEAEQSWDIAVLPWLSECRWENFEDRLFVSDVITFPDAISEFRVSMFVFALIVKALNVPSVLINLEVIKRAACFITFV